MANTLNLVGDGDDLDVVEAVEAAFELQFSDDEVTSIETVGDFHDVLVKRLSPMTERSKRCLTAATYYVLRRAIRKTRPDLHLQPKTRLSHFIGVLNRNSCWKQLEAETGLRLPPLDISNSAAALGFAMLCSPVLWTFLPDPFPPYTILVSILSIPFMILAARSIPRHCPTLGSLAEMTSAINFGQLSTYHETLRSRDVWDALVLLIRQTTGARIPIDRNTTFFA